LVCELSEAVSPKESPKGEFMEHFLHFSIDMYDLRSI
jgi:hypothetical protein